MPIYSASERSKKSPRRREKVGPQEGRYVAVNNGGGGGGYVLPQACASDEDVDPVLETEYYRQIRESGVQDSDIRENDWLNFYSEYAFFPLWETKLKFGVPLEIKKVVVQTREAIESKEKLKAGNAIFYISFRDCGQTEDHRAVVRRTTDGLPGHVSLS